MTKYTVYFTTTIGQSVEVDIDVEPEYNGFEDAIDEAFDRVESVPFLGWNFDSSGDWEPTFVVNEDTGQDYTP